MTLQSLPLFSLSHERKICVTMFSELEVGGEVHQTFSPALGVHLNRGPPTVKQEANVQLWGPAESSHFLGDLEFSWGLRALQSRSQGFQSPQFQLPKPGTSLPEMAIAASSRTVREPEAVFLDPALGSKGTSTPFLLDC